MRKTIAIAVLLVSVYALTAQQEITDPLATEKWNPVPVVVTPGEGTQPPSDAIILLGKDNDLSMWESTKGGKVKWDFDNGTLTVKKNTGGIRTRNYFGDCQLHVEWRTPETVSGEGQGRGNSGIFLMERYEVQVLDSYHNRTYSNGQAASIYKQHIPLVNACRPPGVWQTYDIIWKAPSFHDDGSLKSPATITVLHNGVLVQNHVEIKGTTSFIGIHTYKHHPERLPIMLQDHGNPVSYRNIWIREL
ncbi:MAG: DUF1080 domain-containing protein [Bacteroidales bacterium]|nr:DUF1080 domain-containing protein [Bacteroidales bacterium]MDT8431743.1 DUF1080 domain-containing protein [Bacteroidales bacterium]